MRYANWNTEPGWKWAMRHWRINPAAAILELVLGMALCRDLYVPIGSSWRHVPRRNFTRCHKCGTLRAGVRWRGDRLKGFGNWFGIHCDMCGAEFPLVQNWLTAVVRTICKPISALIWMVVGEWYFAMSVRRLRPKRLRHVPYPRAQQSFPLSPDELS